MRYRLVELYLYELYNNHLFILFLLPEVNKETTTW